LSIQSNPTIPYPDLLFAPTSFLAEGWLVTGSPGAPAPWFGAITPCVMAEFQKKALLDKKGLAMEPLKGLEPLTCALR
jgi:hypothetical protein